MTTRSLVQLRGFFEELPGGGKSISPPDLQNNVPPGVETQLVLTTGANTIVVPTINSVAGAIIVFDPESSVDKTIQGVPGDVGLPLDPNGWCVIPFDPTNYPANIVLTCGGADTGKTTSVIFF